MTRRRRVRQDAIQASNEARLQAWRGRLSEKTSIGSQWVRKER